MAGNNGTIPNGSKWVARSGRHKGGEVSVERTNDLSVFFRDEGGGAAMGKQKDDPSAVHTLGRELFLRRYAPWGALEPGDTRGGRPFRRVAAPKPKPIAPPAAGQPALGLIDTHGAALNIEVMDVTPAQAAAWLANGGKNRHLGVHRVQRYAIAMRRGEWRLTGEAIKLDAHNQVRDGQHRLQAIVESGVTIKTLVVRGVDEEAFDVMDTGRARVVADVLGIHGLTNVNAMAAAVRALILIERFGTVNATTDEARAAATAPASVAYVEAHPDIAEGNSLAQPVRKVLTGGAGLWTAMLTLAWRADQASAAEFAHQLATGIGLEDGSPALWLRNRTLVPRGRGRQAQWHRQEQAVAFALAWNAYRQGKTLKSPRVKGDELLPVLA